MQRLFLLALTFLACMCKGFAQNDTLLIRESVLIAPDAKISYTYHGARSTPDLVPGIRGNGWRTDGYSTWLSIPAGQFKKLYGLSGWFALESYPTDTAAFFSVTDSVTKRSLSICADRFGQLLIGTGTGNAFKYYPVKQQVAKFKWIQLGLALSGNQLRLFVNGKYVTFQQDDLRPISHVTHIIVARDVRQKKEWLSDLTIMNGIVAGFKIWTNPVSEKQWQKDASLALSATPVLAIPGSRFAGDFSRPAYHLLPSANWTNETHGLLFYNNRYHIFNQKNASGLALRQINWGHFSSPDLINWVEHKPVLTPEPGYDKNGIWSGHTVLDDQGKPVILYTAGGDTMGIALAFPKDSNLLEWEKYKHNPVIAGPPPGFKRTDQRDTYVWKENGKWYMIIGYGIETDVHRGAVLLYTSADLKHWSFIHTLFEGQPSIDHSGIFWEMPVFRKIGQKYILLVNKVPEPGIPARALYWTGEFRNEKFIPDNPVPRNFEVINRLLSPSVTLDKDGRLIAIAIIPDEVGGRIAYEHGWTHLYSIPRVWGMQGDKITQQPHPALTSLRGKQVSVARTLIKEDKPLEICKGMHQVEIMATLLPGGAGKFGFYIGKNQDNREYTKIYYDTKTSEWVVDQQHSSLNEQVHASIKKDRYPLDLTKPVRIHLFIDGSVAEIFINDEDAFTTRIFPTRENSNQVEVFTEGGDIEASVDIWKLKPAAMRADF